MDRLLAVVAAIALLTPAHHSAAAQQVVTCREPGSPQQVALVHGDRLFVGGLDVRPSQVEASVVTTVAWSPAGILAHDAHDAHDTHDPGSRSERVVVVRQGDEVLATWELPGPATSLAWIDERSLLVASADALRRLDVATGEAAVVVIPPMDTRITGALLDPARGLIAYTVQPPGLSPALWTTDLQGGAQQLTDRLPSLVAHAWLPDGRGLLLTTDDGVVLQPLVGDPRVLLGRAPEDVVIDVVPHPDGLTVLVSASLDADTDGDGWVTLNEQHAATRLLEVDMAGGLATLTDLGPDHAPVTIAVDDLAEQLVLVVDDQSSEPTITSHWAGPLDDPDAATPLTQEPAEGIGSAAFAPTCTDRLDRAAGETRVETAAAVSAATWPTSALAVLARADRPVDALVGGPLTGGAAPLLLTIRGAALHPATAAELRRLGSDRVIVVGGAGGVGDAAIADLVAMGIEVDPVEGTDPYGLAASITDRLTPSRVLLVRGEADSDDGWPDAVSAAAWATRDGLAILPTPVDRLDPTTRRTIEALGVPVTIIGGPAAVSGEVAQAVADLGVAVDRLGGLTRLETSAAVADAAYGDAVGAVWLATAANWPDTLAVAPAAAATGAPSLLVDPGGLVGSPTGEWIAAAAEPDVQVRLAGGADVLAQVLGLQALELAAGG